MSNDKVEPMEAKVLHELEELLLWARAMHEHYGRTARQDSLWSGPAYVGGAMTMLRHLALITEDEYQEWHKRIQDELPPQNGGLTLRING